MVRELIPTRMSMGHRMSWAEFLAPGPVAPLDRPPGPRHFPCRSTQFSGRPQVLAWAKPLRWPVDSVLNNGGWQGGTPPPCDPLGFRASIGAADRAGRLRNLIPERRDGGLAAVGEAAISHPEESVARDIATLRRDSYWASSGRSLSSASLDPPRV